jgi:hypothetical protein
MRRALATAALLAGILFVPARLARADRLWTLQLTGGSVVLSLDPPEERGTTLVFHRHPDGLFSSLRAGDVKRITLAEGPVHKPKPSLDGKIMIFGRDADPPTRTVRRMPRDAGDAGDFGGGDADSTQGEQGVWTSGTTSAPPPRPPRMHRMRIGSNGFPTGLRILPVGPNGFPMLAPTPVFGRGRFANGG